MKLIFISLISITLLSIFAFVYFFGNEASEKFKLRTNKNIEKLNYDKLEYFGDLTKRTESLPFVTGDTFRIFADYALDQVNTSLPRIIFTKQKPIIFVKTDYLSKFFVDYFHKFSEKIILITHNSDYSITRNYIKYLDNEKLDVWFALNPEFMHPKLIPIPIGFINAHFTNEYFNLLKEYKDKTKPWNERKIVLYINFNENTNKKSRSKYLKFFENFKGVKINKKRVDFRAFFEDLSNSKFVLCPRDNGLDTHRFYETILMGAIPVVASSTLDSIYNKSTSLIVPSFENLNESMLAYPKNYIKDMNFTKNIIFMKYWLKIIYSFRKNNNFL